MNSLRQHVSEYGASQHFFFLEDDLKPHAEVLLDYFCEASDELSNESIVKGFSRVASCALSADTKRGFPRILRHYVEYLGATGHIGDSEAYTDFIDDAEARFVSSIRDDGSVKGETVRNRHTAVGRNEPCPCGSGKKFKRCCGR